jgi:hypothetical protein
MTTPQRKPIDVVHVLTFAIGMLMAGFGAWLTLDSRVTRVETTVENAQLSQVPTRLATIETLLRNTENNAGQRK